MNIEKAKISDLKLNPANPRVIRDEKFAQLVRSVRDFPKMLEIRPIVVNDKMEVLGGNMRLRACIEAGLKEVPIIKASDLADDQQREFIIKDNVGYGEWDWEALGNEWDAEELSDWGLDVPDFAAGGGSPEDGEENNYSTKIEPPVYEPKNEKPDCLELFDRERADKLIQEIERAEIPQNEKDFLKIAAMRHIVFNYEKIADYYAHSSPEVQRLMEDSALVVIDLERAIELGYARLSDEFSKLYAQEYQDIEN